MADCFFGALASAKPRGALFHERLAPLQCILALANFGLNLDLPLELRAVTGMLAFLQQLSRGDQRTGRPLGEAMGKLHRRVEQAIVIHNLPYQSPLQRTLCGKRLVQKHQFERTLAADQARQQPSRTEIGHEADPAENLNKVRRTRRNDDVAGHCKAEIRRRPQPR